MQCTGEFLAVPHCGPAAPPPGHATHPAASVAAVAVDSSACCQRCDGSGVGGWSTGRAPSNRQRTTGNVDSVAAERHTRGDACAQLGAQASPLCLSPEDCETSPGIEGRRVSKERASPSNATWRALPAAVASPCRTWQAAADFYGSEVLVRGPTGGLNGAVATGCHAVHLSVARQTAMCRPHAAGVPYGCLWSRCVWLLSSSLAWAAEAEACWHAPAKWESVPYTIGAPRRARLVQRLNRAVTSGSGVFSGKGGLAEAHYSPRDAGLAGAPLPPSR